MTDSALSPQSHEMVEWLRYKCSGCETLVPASTTSCSHCQLARPQKLVVSNADLVGLIVNSGIAVFSVDVEFLAVLRIKRQLPIQVPVESPAKKCNMKQFERQNASTERQKRTLSKNYNNNDNSNDNNNDKDDNDNNNDKDDNDNSNDNDKDDNDKDDNSNNNDNDNTPRSIRGLRDHMLPGLHALAPEPAVYSNLTVTAKMKRACSILQTNLSRYIKCHSPEYAHEMILSQPFRNKHEVCMAGVPDRVEPGYYKAHLSSNFVTDNFGDSCLPHGIRIKKRTNQKAIAFFSTTAETLSNTHYDQDPSFLFVLKGMKQIMYARPSIAKMYEKARIVESHSSIFEGINPFKTRCSGWECMTLTSGDGLLLPQNWLHAVKSSPGTLAISFQVESTGEVRFEPEVKRQKRQTTPSFLILNSTIQRKRKKFRRSDIVKPIEIVMTEKPKGKRQLAQTVITNKNANISHGHMTPCDKSIQIQKLHHHSTPTYSGVRKSNRAKILCGNDNCHNSFLTSGLMWMLIRKDANWDIKLLSNLYPVVPISHPKHLICFDCIPQNGQELLCTSEVFNNYDKAKLKEWRHYVFCAASRGDYMAQTEKLKAS